MCAGVDTTSMASSAGRVARSCSSTKRRARTMDSPVARQGGLEVDWSVVLHAVDDGVLGETRVDGLAGLRRASCMASSCSLADGQDVVRRRGRRRRAAR